jgi:hypothetical protein
MTETIVADDPAATNPVRASVPFPKIFHRLAGWSLFFCIVSAALVAGLILRRWAWDQTEPIRYAADINNAFRQGTLALRSGYIERYDEQESRPEHEGMMDLDYAPGRLAVATLWSRWVWSKWDPTVTDYQDLPDSPPPFYGRARELGTQYELCKPLLMVNLTGEILSVVALFFLVRRYTTGKPPIFRPVRGTILGLIAALFFWFDPALICNAHCWPQWDSWVLPFFLWAILLASLDWWFCSGVFIAAGAMFKGQILFGAPVFLLWPLFQGRLPAVLRWIVGLCFAVASITAVWLVRIPGTRSIGNDYLPGMVNKQAVEWLVDMALLFLLLPVFFWWLRKPTAFIQRYVKNDWQAKVAVGVLLLVTLLWPLHHLPSPWLKSVIIVTAGMAVFVALAPRSVIPYAAAGWMATAAFLCIPIFNASHGWFDLGLAYGTHHYERMANGQINNLAELLQQQWGWDDLMAPAATIPAGNFADHVAQFLNTIDPGVHLESGHDLNFPLKYFLVCAWLIAVILCAMGAANHDRNRSPRFLAAVAAPWIVFFAVMTQMHQRYLLWGASLSAATAVLSPGYAFLHLFLSIVSLTQELQSMMNNSFDPANHLQYTHNAVYQFIKNWHPGIAWAVLLTAAIFLYTAVKWDGKAKLTNDE